jgi:hypothetical protein
MDNATMDMKNCAFDAYQPRGTLNLRAFVGGAERVLFCCFCCYYGLP